MFPFDPKKPLYALTVGEFVELNELIYKENLSQQPILKMTEDQTINSIKSLAEFIHCSIPTAQKFKNKFPEIFHQYGRKFLVNKSDVLTKMNNKST
jgi:hypothetical protein